MYKPISKEDRKKYIKNRISTLLYGTIFAIIVLVFELIATKKITIFGIGFALNVLIIMSIITLFRLLLPVNAFSKKLQMTDGYLFNRNQYSDSDGHRTLYANAKTMNGQLVTPKRSIPYDMYSGQIPVKIIIYKNKARDFILTEESYEYAKEVNRKNNV